MEQSHSEAEIPKRHPGFAAKGISPVMAQSAAPEREDEAEEEEIKAEEEVLINGSIAVTAAM